jgi:tetratricopeptide (TPR) repeat protein
MSIKCPKCHHDNPLDSTYCQDCGTPLPQDRYPQTKTFTTPVNELTKGRTFARRYHIIEKLGRGGMGEVYKVKDTKLDEEVALKLIKPEIANDSRTIQRFRNELKLARKITHKNVCRMFDFHEEGKIPFITMEYVQGESLKASIQKQGIIPEEKTIDIAQQIGRGLSEAHEWGVVHRDLKPQNIMIDAKGNAKIMDFGIAHSLEVEGVTQTGMMIGTPDYMSPEQAEGLEADQRSDIYSLGIILYEMATGKVPFEGDTALSVALKHKTEAPADPIVGEAYNRAFELCKKIGETPMIIPVLAGLWPFYFTKAELKPAIAIADQVLRLAPKKELEALPYLFQAGTLTQLGEFTQALEHAQQGIDIYDPMKHGSSIFLLGYNLKPVITSWLAIDLWFLGYPDQAKQKFQHALSFLREYNHPYSLSFVYYWKAMFHQFCQDVQGVKKTSNKEISLSTEYGFLLWLAAMPIFLGWITAEKGKPKEGIAQIKQGIATIKATSSWCWHIHYLAMLAEAYKRAGQIDDGLATIEESLALMEKTGQRYFEAELHRLKGEFLRIKDGDEAEVQSLFERAIGVAREQKAKSLELRATVNLARLWHKQGKKKEAYKKLSEISGWFTEGFDTQDLKDAEALLKELS